MESQRILGRRLSAFLELQMAMVLGALICVLVGRLVGATSTYATDYHPGAFLFFFSDVFFFSVPVVVDAGARPRMAA